MLWIILPWNGMKLKVQSKIQSSKRIQDYQKSRRSTDRSHRADLSLRLTNELWMIVSIGVTESSYLVTICEFK